MSKETKNDEIIVKGKKVTEKSPVEMPKEYWATNSPYVEAYIRALNYANYSPVDTYTDAEENITEAAQPVTATGAKKPADTNKKGAKKPKIKKVYKKRSFFIMLFGILMLACVVVAGLGIVTPLGGYLAPYLRTNDEYVKDKNDATFSVSFIDPIYSLIKYFGGPVEEADAAKSADTATEDTEAKKSAVNFTNYYLTDELEALRDVDMKEAKSSEVIHAILVFAFPIIIIFFLIMCVYLFIKCIVAMASKKKKKKFKLGYAWFITLLFLLGTVIMGMMWNGLGMNEIKQYFLYGICDLFNIKIEGQAMISASTISMGLGLWIELAIMVVSLIPLCLSYKRVNKPVKKADAAKKGKSSKERAAIAA